MILYVLLIDSMGVGNMILPYLTSGTVMELSAIFVAKIILRVLEAAFWKAKFLCLLSDIECSTMVSIRVPFMFLNS